MPLVAAVSHDLLQLVACFLTPSDARAFDACCHPTRLDPITWCRVLVAQLPHNVWSFLKVDTRDLMVVKRVWLSSLWRVSSAHGKSKANIAIHILLKLLHDDVDGFLELLRDNWWIWEASYLDRTGYANFYILPREPEQDIWTLLSTGCLAFAGQLDMTNTVERYLAMGDNGLYGCWPPPPLLPLLARLVYLGFSNDPVQITSLKELIAHLMIPISSATTREQVTALVYPPKPTHIHSHAKTHGVLR
jgi:hypothetical protein